MNLRELRLGLTDITANSEDLEDGSFVVRQVPLLAVGTWTDSVVRVPTAYTSAVLKEFATNWVDKSIFDKHSGGVPRSITSKVGELENIQYDDSRQAIVGDLHFHGLTETSKDTITLVKNKQAQFVSVEHGGDATFDPAAKQYKMTSLIFSGIAVVLRGACATCKIDLESLIMENEDMPVDPETGAEPQDEQEEEQNEIELRLIAVEEKMAAMDSLIAEVIARLDKIEMTPEPQLSVVPFDNERSLSAPKFEIKINKIDKTISRKL